MERAARRQVIERLSPFAPIVFDLDGTLVRLEVRWGEAQLALAHIASRFGRPSDDRTVWQMLRDATGEEAAALDTALKRYEIDGGARAKRLPLGDVLPHLTGRGVGVVTLNCHACAEEALLATGLRRHVQAIVAREDTARLKPDPEPLLLCIERLDGKPEGAVFVGDRERDRETAQAAGTSYKSVEEVLG